MYGLALYIIKATPNDIASSGIKAVAETELARQQAKAMTPRPIEVDDDPIAVKKPKQRRTL